MLGFLEDEKWSLRVTLSVSQSVGLSIKYFKNSKLKLLTIFDIDNRRRRRKKRRKKGMRRRRRRERRSFQLYLELIAYPCLLKLKVSRVVAPSGALAPIHL